MNFFQDFTQMFTKDQFINGALKAKDYLAVGIDKGNRPGSIIKYPEVKIVTMKKIKDFTDQPLKEVLVVGNTTEGKDIVVTANDDITFTDTSKILMGAGSDLRIYHDGSNSYIEGAAHNNAGNLIIRHKDAGRDLVFQGDNGDGDSSSSTYFLLDSSMANTGNPDVYTRFPDNSRLVFGNSANANSLDLEIYHEGSASYIKNGTTDLMIESKGGIYIENDTSDDINITNKANDGDIIFYTDNGSGSTAEYLRFDGGYSSPMIRIPDGVTMNFGSANDLQIVHKDFGGSDQSWIRDVGTNDLILDTNGAQIALISDGDVSTGKMGLFKKDGAVELYYDNNKKFETTNTGITVTGIAVADGLDLGDSEKIRLGDSQEVTIEYTSANKTELTLPNLPDSYTAANQVFVENGFMKIGPSAAISESCMHSTIDYFGNDSSDTGNRYAISIHITNKTTGSPDINQTYHGPQDIYFKRQNAAAATQGGMPWNLYSNQYTPAVDSGYDAGMGISGSHGSGLRVNVEPSTADINAANYSGNKFLGTNWNIYTTDVGTLKSLRLPVSIKIDGNGSSPGNGTLGLRVIDHRNTAPNAAMDDVVLPSTVYVYFRDTTLTSSKMGRPPFNLLWAGKDTTFAKFQNSGQTYTAGCDYVFSGNSSAQVSGKYELFFQDEIESQGRFSNLKVTDGRVVMQDLPTSDPVSKGVLWNDSGTLKVSAG